MQFDGAVPTVLDRFIQQAVMQVLQADWDGTFSEASFGFRPGRSAHHPTYTVRQQDIDEQRLSFRRLISELVRVADIKPKATVGLSAARFGGS